MANQIIVTQSGNVQVSIEPPANVQVQISRAAIGTVSNVPTANFANYAANVTSSSQPNITSLGTLVNLTSAGNITAPFFIGNVIGNISGNIVVPGTNTSVLFNQQGSAGASDAFKFNYATNVATITGNLSATNISGNGAGLSNITGANVSGQVGYAGIANSVSGGNVSGAVAYATTANAVAGANVSGQVAYAAVANSVAGANVSGYVANATHSNVADVANSVAGANVSGQVAYAAVANSVSVGNVSGIGNIATVNLTGSTSNVLYGNGVFAPVVATNANYANFAGTAFSVSGSNVSGAVNLANYATTANAVAGANVSGQVSYAAVANSVAGANVSGDVSGANHANVADLANSVSGGNVTGQVANALVAGTVYTNAQPNITSVGTLTTLSVTGDITSFANITGDYFLGNGALLTGVGNFSAALGYHGGFFSNVTQTIASTTTAYPITLNNTSPGTYGVSVTSNSRVTFTYAGTYNIQYSVQFTNTDNAVHNASIWLRKNGVDVPDTNSVFAVTARHGTIDGQLIGAVNYIEDVNANDYYQLIWQAESTSVSLEYIAPGTTPTSPAAPSIIVTAMQVTNVQAATLSGNLTGNLIGNTFGLTGTSFINIIGNISGNVFTGNGSGLTELTGANVTGAVAYATTANSVAVANVSGIGNIATINLTGSSSNVLYGNGVFAPESQTGNANFASYAGNVTVAAQSNITSLGNLVSLTVRDSNVSNPITQFIPTGNVIGTATFGNTMLRIDNYTDLGNANGVQNISFVKSRGNATTPVATANNDVAMRVASYVYNGNAYPKVGQIQFVASQAANANLQLANTAWTAGIFQVIVGNPYGNVANASSNTNINQLAYNQNGTLVLLSGTNTGGVTAPQINMINYGVLANGVGASAGGIFVQRARGNRDSNVAVGNTDQIGSLSWQAYNGNAFFSTRFAQITANVNTAHGAIANGASIPTDVNLITCSNTASFTTTFYGNGTVTFPGDITSTGTATITTSNIANTQLNRFQETVYAIGSTSGTITPDFVNGSIQTMTLTGSITMNTLANAVAGRSMTLIVTQGGTGSYTLTSSMLFAGGIKTLSTAVGAKDIISVFYDGSSYYASLTKGYV